MKSTAYTGIGAPIRLRLEYGNLTAGELGGILIQWQALLRRTWHSVYLQDYDAGPPTVRLFTKSVSSEHSIEIVTDFAILSGLLQQGPEAMVSAYHLLSEAPLREWSTFGRTVHAYLAKIWRVQQGRSESISYDNRIVIRGGQDPSISLHLDALEDKETAERLLKFWDTANRGNVVASIHIDVHPSSHADKDK